MTRQPNPASAFRRRYCKRDELREAIISSLAIGFAFGCLGLALLVIAYLKNI